MRDLERCAGVLAAVSSLPGNQGIGDFGRKTRMFIDMIARAGFTIGSCCRRRRWAMEIPRISRFPRLREIRCSSTSIG
ncbi:MAG: hypothetical protein V8T10_09320 [Merdibacter sp.]